MALVLRIVAGGLLIAHGLVHLLYLDDDVDVFTFDSWAVPDTQSREVGLVLMRATIVAFGAKDRSLTDVPGKLDDALTQLGVEHDIAVYPDAGHGFLDDHAPGEKPIWARIAGSFVHDGYHQPSATDARGRIITFVNTHLKAGPPS